MNEHNPYAGMVCCHCQSPFASHYEPWAAGERWYCGRCVPQPVRDYHRLRHAVQHALGQLPTVAAYVPAAERRVFARVLEVLRDAEVATRHEWEEAAA